VVDPTICAHTAFQVASEGLRREGRPTGGRKKKSRESKKPTIILLLTVRDHYKGRADLADSVSEKKRQKETKDLGNTQSLGGGPQAPGENRTVK